MKTPAKHGQPKLGPDYTPRSARQDLSKAESQPTHDESLDYSRSSLLREISRTGGLIGSQS